MAPPSLNPPPGYTRLGRAGESLGPEVLVANSVTIAFAIIAWMLRMNVKLFIVHQTQIDDCLATLALLAAIVRMVLQVILVENYQFGQHIWDFETNNLAVWYKWDKVAVIIYFFAITCAKASLLLFYLRLFRVHQRFKWFCFVLLAIIIGYCVSLSLTYIFQCHPVSAGWNFFEPGQCLSLARLIVVIGGFNIATDFLIVVMPIPLVAKLQLRATQMTGVLLVIATGFVVVAVAIVRQVEIAKTAISFDQTWDTARLDMWLSVELHVGILGTCLPALSPIRRKLPSQSYFHQKYSFIRSILRERTRSRFSSKEPEVQERNSDSFQLVESGLAGKNDSASSERKTSDGSLVWPSPGQDKAANG